MAPAPIPPEPRRLPPPVLVMTCGDPAGIGPEIAAKLAGDGGPPFVWIGDSAHLPPGTPWQEVAVPADATLVPDGHLPVLRHPFPAPAQPGRPDRANAAATIAVIERAAGAEGRRGLRLSRSHRISGASGRGASVAMMLACDALRVVPATIHIPLAEVPAQLTAARCCASTIRLTHAALRRDFGMPAPRLAVAGLNPHAGEGGTMGREEIELIAPVLDELRAEGMSLRGPLPADTMFHAAARAGYDAAVCDVSRSGADPDQDHRLRRRGQCDAGPALRAHLARSRHRADIAGRGLADPSSLIAPRCAWPATWRGGGRRRRDECLRRGYFHEEEDVRGRRTMIDALPPLREVIARTGCARARRWGRTSCWIST
jgi:4-hydroxythreonine-4-phosphate dehydrogenase